MAPSPVERCTDFSTVSRPVELDRRLKLAMSTDESLLCFAVAGTAIVVDPVAIKGSKVDSAQRRDRCCDRDLASISEELPTHDDVMVRHDRSVSAIGSVAVAASVCVSAKWLTEVRILRRKMDRVNLDPSQTSRAYTRAGGRPQPADQPLGNAGPHARGEACCLAARPSLGAFGAACW